MIACSLCPPAEAGTTGRLTGRVLDATKQPVAGANVAVPAARTGAVTEADGRYVIVNLPSGQYDVRVSLLGYQQVLVQGAVISADNTTTLDVTLKETPVQLPEVVVTAERPVVDVNLTSSLASITRKELNALPVQELADVVNLQAGVVDGHFRGGRLGEVQYQVDGVTVNNPFNNASTLRLDRSLLEEVQVIGGTFDAEYGQAMGGVVNAVLRSGGERYEWDAEAFAGGFYYGGNTNSLFGFGRPVNPRRIEPFEFRPADVQNYQLTTSGPARILPQTTFLATGRYYRFNDYVRAERRFTPTRATTPQGKIAAPDGDGKDVPLGYTREWSGVGKLTNRSLPGKEIGYQAIWNVIQRRDASNANYRFRLNPDGMKQQRTFSITHGLDFTQTLGKTSFCKVSIRHNYLDYDDLLYKNLFDSRYDRAGETKGDPNETYEPGAFVEGVDFGRFEQSTRALVAKGTYQTELARDHHLKLGTEYQFASVRFGNPGHLRFVQDPATGKQVVARYVDDPVEGYLPVREYRPVSTSAYAQDEIEWNDLRLRAGLRFDFFDARTLVPNDLANPANTIQGVPTSRLVPTSNKISFSPRLGVSFPITRDAALFFAYGHFYQMSALGQAFDNADYRLLSQLQAATEDRFPTMGNPDIKPERTVQYQFGYKQAVTDWLGLDLSAFYKDIRDLLGVEFIFTYNGARYARFTNVDFGNVLGFTVALDQRQLGWVRSTMDYTWQQAQGNSSDPNETATRAEAGEDPRPRLVPLNWDQRHTLNLTVHIAWPRGLSSSAVFRAASGQPYTPALTPGSGGSLEANSGRKPAGILLDLRAERRFGFAGLDASLFGRAFNLFDARFFNNGLVFNSSGSPYYTAYRVGGDLITLNDPTRFFAPRRIEIGMSWRGGAR
jgi:outer membrane receptor protein involved in Fe transport